MIGATVEYIQARPISDSLCYYIYNDILNQGIIYHDFENCRLHFYFPCKSTFEIFLNVSKCCPKLLAELKKDYELCRQKNFNEISWLLT